jgi:hypothetical protein
MRKWSLANRRELIDWILAVIITAVAFGAPLLLAWQQPAVR